MMSLIGTSEFTHVPGASRHRFLNVLIRISLRMCLYAPEAYVSHRIPAISIYTYLSLSFFREELLDEFGGVVLVGTFVPNDEISLHSLLHLLSDNLQCDIITTSSHKFRLLIARKPN